MTDHKFTDNEIIKALLCCANQMYYCKDKECKAKTLGNAIDLINRQKREIESLQAVHADMTESLRLAAEANKDMSVELNAMRGAANSYKMHYEEAERKYKIAVAEREANVEGFIETLKTIKSEAIKEFAERLKAKEATHFCKCGRTFTYTDLFNGEIDNLVKEMTEGGNTCE